MKNLSTEFHAGDIVMATKDIRNSTEKLRAGEKAVVNRTWRETPNDPQIIDLKLSNGALIIDIVCFENVPLEKLTSQFLPECTCDIGDSIPSVAHHIKCPLHVFQD